MKHGLKRTLTLLLTIFCVLSIASCTKNENDDPNGAASPTLSAEELADVKAREVRGVWMAYSEVGELIKTYPTESEFTNALTQNFIAAAEAGFNTIYFHVRAFGDAFYQSAYFPSTAYFGKQGVEMPYDVLKIAVQAAHEHNLKLEAWVNPYRVSLDQNLDLLADTNQAKIWLTDGEPSNDNRVIKVNDGGLYYNPAIPECQQLIVNGIKEIVTSYQVDGVHFDDYFYPSAEAYIDEADYQAYMENGGTLSLQDWRCENVNALIKAVYQCVKEVNPAVMFGVSPAASVQDNKTKQFADLRLWATEKGYVDYLCPQIYFGFTNQSKGFISTVKSWQSLMRGSEAKLYIGLALYKSGKVDEYADDTDGEDTASPKYEFVNNNDIIMRQINYIRQIEPYDGFSVFSYSYLFDNDNETVKQEAEHIKSVLK